MDRTKILSSDIMVWQAIQDDQVKLLEQKRAIHGIDAKMAAERDFLDDIFD